MEQAGTAGHVFAMGANLIHKLQSKAWCTLLQNCDYLDEAFIAEHSLILVLPPIALGMGMMLVNLTRFT